MMAFSTFSHHIIQLPTHCQIPPLIHIQISLCLFYTYISPTPTLLRHRSAATYISLPRHPSLNTCHSWHHLHRVTITLGKTITLLLDVSTCPSICQTLIYVQMWLFQYSNGIQTWVVAISLPGPNVSIVLRCYSIYQYTARWHRHPTHFAFIGIQT